MRRVAGMMVALLLMGCAPTTRLKIAMRMRPDQSEIYRNRILKPFEKKHHCIVEVTPYEDPARLPELLSSAQDTIDLVDPPNTMTTALVAKNLIVPLNEILSEKEMADLRREYFLMDIAGVKGQAYFLPRYLETPVIVYMKSRVAEAVQYWENRRPDINRALARYNGRGLPRNYTLEKDPGQWDAFDLFVVGYYWSLKEVQGQRHGRMALGAPGSTDFPQSLLDKCFQSGATADGILRMDDETVLDMFQWQAVMAREGAFPPELTKSRWSETQVRQAFQSGDLFLAEATQMEAFVIHGTGTPEMPGFLANPEDMGVAQMPKGGSLLVDARGDPLREGRRNVATRGWWWGVTRQARNRALAYQLAHYLSGTENQIVECSAFGIIPVRQDLLGDLGLMFGGGWTAELFQTASQQLVENRFTVAPQLEEFSELSRNYAEAYQEICLPGAGQRTRFEDIRKALEDRYLPRQRQILGAKYPARALSAR